MRRIPFGVRAGALLALTIATACGERDAAPPAVEAVATVPTGRIEGVVRLRGEHPSLQHQPNVKQPEVCGSQVTVTRIELGQDNGVGQAFVYLDNVPASGPPRPVASITVEQKDCSYSPHAMLMTPGAKLDIVNDDPVLHNVHAKAMTEGGRETVFNIAQPVRGQRTRIDTPLKAGILTLTCEAGHPWMTAHMLVAEHGFVALTDEGGRFVIDEVPAGTYPIRMWHEGVALTRIIPSLEQYEYEAPYELSQDIVVKAGDTTKVEFDFQLR